MDGVVTTVLCRLREDCKWLAASIACGEDEGRGHVSWDMAIETRTSTENAKVFAIMRERS